LWHGASWNFVIWGMFHGFFLVFERTKFGENFVNFLPKFAQNFYAIFVVMIGWVFFRSQDLNQAMSMLKLMFCGNSAAVVSSATLRLMESHVVLSALVLAFIGCSPLVKNCYNKAIKRNSIAITIFDLMLVAVLLLALIRISASTHNPFIYFQF